MENQSKKLSLYSLGTSIWQLVTVIFVLGMTLSWFLLWNQWFYEFETLNPLISLSLFAALVLIITFLIARYLTQTNNNPRNSLMILISFLLLSIAIGIELIDLPAPPTNLALDPNEIPFGIINFRTKLPEELVIGGIILLVWWAGSDLGRYQGIQKGVFSQIKIGIGMFVLYAIASIIFGENLPLLALGSFLFFALLSMATSRLALVGYSRGGTRVPFSFKWLIGVSSSVFLVITAALTLGLSFGKDLGQGIVALLGKLTQLYFSILGVLFTPFLYIMDWMSGDRNSDASSSAQEEITAYSFVKPTFPDIYSPEIDRDNMINIIILVVGILLLIFILRFVFKKITTATQNYELVENETVSETGLLSAFGRAMKNPMQSIREGIDSLRMRYLENILASIKIRRIYAKFLNLCIDLDIPRPQALTPLEFIKVAERELTTLGTEIRLITEAYMKIRYGGLEEKEAEIEEVEAAWNQIQETVKEL